MFNAKDFEDGSGSNGSKTSYNYKKHKMGCKRTFDNMAHTFCTRYTREIRIIGLKFKG